MKKIEQEKYLNLPTIAYWSVFNGVEVKKIEYGINDYCICVCDAWTKARKVHRLKIRTNNNGYNYILINNTRLFFDDCVYEVRL